MQQRDLVERARHGDHDAFAVLVHEGIGRLYAIAGLLLGDRPAAEDAVQEALLKAWRDLPSLRDANRFEAWLRRLLVNACHDEGRRRRRRNETPLLGDGHVAPIDAFAGVVRRDELERAFRWLRTEDRAVVVLRYYLELPTAEAAASLGMREGTLKSKLHRALKALAAALAAEARATETTQKGRAT
jgi:RNA polymerase sigma-70 factor (ECF subfamily)